MTAVRLRGQDAINRALEAHELHTQQGYDISDLCDHYEATPRAVYNWLQLAKKHLLPDLDDKVGWFRLILQDQGSRLEDAKDADAVRIAQLLSQLMGVGSVEELRAQMVRLETAKVVLIAQAFDEATADLPERRKLRAAFLDAIEAHEPALTA